MRAQGQHGRSGPMRQATVAVLLILLVAVLPAVAGQPWAPEGDPVELTPRERLFLEAHGPLRHVAWIEVPPVVFTDERGKTVGIDLDVLALASVRLGLEVEVVRAANLSEGVAMLARGEADTLSPVVPTEALDEHLDFTTPYIAGGIGFWVDEDRPGLDTHEDLAPGARVAVVPGAVSQRWLADNRPDLAVVEVGDIEEGLVRVRDGDAQAYLGSFASVAYLLESDPELAGLRPLGDMVVRSEASFAVPDGNNELLSIMNKALASVGNDDFQVIYHKWTGFDLSPTRPDPAVQVQPWHWGLGAGLIAITGLFALATVVLRRKVLTRTDQLRESEERHRRLFEDAPIGLFRTTPTGEVLDANPYIVRLFGYESKEALLADPRRLYADPSYRERWGAILQEHGKVEGFEVPMVARDGAPLWVQFDLRPIHDENGELVAFESSMLDITERRRAQEQLAARAEELARSNAELERFAYVASHDLKEPVRMVSSYTKLLARRLDHKLTAEERELVGFALEGAERMHRLIEDLLEYARVDREGAAFEPVDLNEVLRDVIADLRPQLLELGARIDVDPLPTVLGERAQLGQVFLNLVSNAIKFRGEEPPHVQVRAGSHEGGWTLTVADNGIGIAPAYHEHVFEIFKRLHGRRDFAGTGVGLAIVKRIVEHHGGRVWVESEEGHGATFCFELPALAVDPSATGAYAVGAEDARSEA